MRRAADGDFEVLVLGVRSDEEVVVGHIPVPNSRISMVEDKKSWEAHQHILVSIHSL